MKSKIWIAIICSETALAILIAAAIVNRWYGPPASTATTRMSRNISGALTASGDYATSNSAISRETAMKKQNKYTHLDIVAATICAEAGGEPLIGKIKVGEVIANRAIKSGKSQYTVCLKPKALSCWNNRADVKLLIKAMKKHPAWGDCMAIAERIGQPGYNSDSPVTHYANLSKCSPHWAKSMRRVAMVGAHTFFAER